MPFRSYTRRKIVFCNACTGSGRGRIDFRLTRKDGGRRVACRVKVSVSWRHASRRSGVFRRPFPMPSSLRIRFVS